MCDSARPLDGKEPLSCQIKQFLAIDIQFFYFHLENMESPNTCIYSFRITIEQLFLLHI